MARPIPVITIMLGQPHHRYLGVLWCPASPVMTCSVLWGIFQHLFLPCLQPWDWSPGNLEQWCASAARCWQVEPKSSRLADGPAWTIMGYHGLSWANTIYTYIYIYAHTCMLDTNNPQKTTKDNLEFRPHEGHQQTPSKPPYPSSTSFQPSFWICFRLSTLHVVRVSDFVQAFGSLIGPKLITS